MLNIHHYTLDVALEFQPDFVPHSAPGLLRVKALLQVENTGPEPACALSLLFYRLHSVAGVSVDGKATRAGVGRFRSHLVWLTYSGPVAGMGTVTGSNFDKTCQVPSKTVLEPPL